MKITLLPFALLLVVPVAAADYVFGYVPTARILAEGGYETHGIDRGDAVGQFTPETEKIVVDAVKAPARQTGRLP